MRATGIVMGLAVVLAGVPAYAVSQTEFSQTINTGVLSSTILDASQNPVASPALTMSALTTSMQCQTSTGTYGTDSQRIYVENPGASAGGWVLSVAATGGSSAEWSDGGSEQYSFNSGAGSGCTDGQMTLDPSAGTVTPQNPATSTGISKGAQASFVAGSVDSIELVNASASSDDYWFGYIRDIGVSQKVPAGTPAGTYAIDLTQTVVAQ